MRIKEPLLHLTNLALLMSIDAFSISIPGTEIRRNRIGSLLKNGRPKEHIPEVKKSPIKEGSALHLSKEEDQSISQKRKLRNKLISASALILILCWNYEVIYNFFAEQKFKMLMITINEKMVSLLDYLNSLGYVGLVSYSLLLMLWEVTFGITTPVETCAGMAFGVKRGILANAFGKIGGATFAFLLGRFFLSKWVRSKIEGSKSESTKEIFHLIENSFDSNPVRVALVWRFSPLPEFMKNFVLSIMPGLKVWQFFVAVLLHGFPFTCLWTILGNETSMIMRGVVSKPSKTLKIITSLVPPFGLVVSPTLVGLWIKSLKEKQNEGGKKD